MSFSEKHAQASAAHLCELRHLKGEPASAYPFVIQITFVSMCSAAMWSAPCSCGSRRSARSATAAATASADGAFGTLMSALQMSRYPGHVREQRCLLCAFSPHLLCLFAVCCWPTSDRLDRFSLKMQPYRRSEPAWMNANLGFSLVCDHLAGRIEGQQPRCCHLSDCLQTCCHHPDRCCCCCHRMHNSQDRQGRTTQLLYSS